ncbi:Uncharacterised protein [Neisseria animaloris]|uniref:YtxH domain-containing protein n=1 Tax=Neisseria animaloris TaxID=326522 RepID=UPI000A195F5E|nr:YtxH domain-containing protein [Neisseria animaloris]OSI08567.1 hypothetical protein BWD08_00045 [Neisseria animaloris]VEH87497.1 Uncharacterised protein [Neisseria animaloris]
MNNRFFRSFLSALILSLPFAFSAAADTLAEPKQTTASNSPITKTSETATDEQPKINNLTASQAEMLQDNISALRMQVMDNQQQNLNWWMTFITIVFAVAGIVIAAIGVAIPLLLYKKEKRQLEQDLEQAKEYVEKIKEHHDSAEKYTQDIAEMKQWNPKEQNQEAQTSSIEKAKQLSKNEEIPLIEQLRAQAILLSDQAKRSQNYQDNENALYAWQAVLLQDSRDEQANFNAGFHACYLYEKGNRKQQNYWLPKVEQYHQETLRSNPRKYIAAYNWGRALCMEARNLYIQNQTSAAFDKWQSAGEKYGLALQIKNDFYPAANNWGSALAEEAQALAIQGYTVTALEKWRDAGVKFQQALAIEPDIHEVADNWGKALADEAQVLATQGDTATALEKWSDAGEKYRQALTIKPDMHEAAYNWLSALLHELHILKDNQPAEAQIKLQQARNLIDGFLNKYPQHQENFAYNHACLFALEGNTAEAIKQLRLAQRSNHFLNKEHIEQDGGLDNIRHTPEFQAWFKEAFPEFSAES